MDKSSESISLCVQMPSDSALSPDDFRTHFGPAIIELLLTTERAAHLIAAICKEMPDTTEKKKLVNQRCKLVPQAIYLRRLLRDAGVIASQPTQLTVVDMLQSDAPTFNRYPAPWIARKRGTGDMAIITSR
ncbi:hypothetical protein ACKWRH_06320 [Bradyrhizobium sp. Pa8]|uniref:hypothetical protein n=1 Tax=Bradyrhizobium sp. Pa8 TaxID=3386552 RepID=UPI00403F4FFA